MPDPAVDYSAGPVRNALKALSRVEPREIKATLASFCFVFVIMTAYFTLRPVRDAMASDWSDTEVSTLWSMTFFLSLTVVALYGFTVTRVQFRYLVPTVYAFFAVTFVVFFIAVSGGGDHEFMDKSFYVWLSVFAMFHLSVFWSFMSDVFNREQATRLFSIIAAGATAGALLGPAIPTLLAGRLGIETLLLIAATMLIIPVPLILYLAHLKITELDNTSVAADLSEARIGGNPLAGFRLFLRDPYLLTFAAFIFLYTAIAGFVYFEQKNILAVYDRATRAQILGSIEWIVNTLTFVLAFFVTGRLVTSWGMGFTLALMPLFVAGGMLVLSFAPVVTVLLALQIARRAGNYAVTRPAREMLFTEVDRETRFKAKPVVDVVIYRGGDMLSGWLFTGLSQGLGLGLAAIALIGAGIAALWAAVGALLGRMYNRKSNRPDSETLQTGATAAP